MALIKSKMKTKVLINRKTLLAMIPLSERTIYNLEQRGDFPRRIMLTSRNVAWDLAEVEAWIEARKASSKQSMPSDFILWLATGEHLPLINS